MINKDFINGGFPVSRRSPVVCTLDRKVAVAYNNYEFKTILEQMKNPVCIGTWPGKKTTDVFILDPKSYGKYAPPKEHADIDSASTVLITKDKEGNFLRVEYVPGPHVPDATPVRSEDPKLFEYLEKVKIKVIVVTE